MTAAFSADELRNFHSNARLSAKLLQSYHQCICIWIRPTSITFKLDIGSLTYDPYSELIRFNQFIPPSANCSMDLEMRKTLFSACALIALMPACFTSYVPCEPCDKKALSMCPPVPTGCQAVKEPGCGCCLTCALRLGDECGVYTGTCATGLRCLPRLGEEKPLHALLHGRGLCMNKKGYMPSQGEFLH